MTPFDRALGVVLGHEAGGWGFPAARLAARSRGPFHG